MTAAIALLLAATVAGAAEPAATHRRFAVLVGANDGGADRVRLHFAASDARAVDTVLREIGGVSEADRLLVIDPDRHAFFAALSNIKAVVEAARAPDMTTELIVYYSGHSDDQGLLLKGERVTYADLRDTLNTIGADVRIAVLDSCGSGELTRFKGGRRRPAFLVDSANQVKGHAFLTSSSADEVAQESDRIGASFFTHALLSGLRGAADSTGDGRVTLNEAHQFAFQETVARTERTQGGAQHPAYDIELAGSGDVVMTDLRGNSAGLVVAREVEGRLFIRDGAGTLVVEWAKRAGHPVELALDPGLYGVTLDQEGKLSSAQISLADGAHARLETDMLTPMTREPAVPRGAPSVAAEPYRLVPVDLSLLYLGRSGHSIDLLAVSLLVGGSARLRGLSLAVGGSWIEEDSHGVQSSVGFNRVGGDMRGAQLSVGTNVAQGGATGVQLSVGANIDTGQLWGVQAVAGVNVAEEVHGVQLSAGGNVATGHFSGVAGSAGFNWMAAGWTGVMLSAGATINPAGESRGVAATAGVNWIEGPFVGAELTSGVNYAGTIRGAQIGVLNIGGDVSGAQVGVLNIAGTAHGTQIGVVNIASDSTAPIGLLNLIGGGLHHLELWYGDEAPVNVGLKLGGRTLYSTVAAGYDWRSPTGIVSDYLGIGGHFPAGRLWFDLDAGVSNQTRLSASWGRPDNLIAKLRLTAGFSFAEHFSVISGVSMNVLAEQATSEFTATGFGYGWGVSAGSVRIWPGPFLGLQI